MSGWDGFGGHGSDGGTGAWLLARKGEGATKARKTSAEQGAKQSRRAITQSNHAEQARRASCPLCSPPLATFDLESLSAAHGFFLAKLPVLEGLIRLAQLRLEGRHRVLGRLSSSATSQKSFFCSKLLGNRVMKPPGCGPRQKCCDPRVNARAPPYTSQLNLKERVSLWPASTMAAAAPGSAPRAPPPGGCL